MSDSILPKRTAKQPLAVRFYVLPDGVVKRAKWAPNVNNGYSGLDRAGRLSARMREKGCVMLEELYAQDSREDVRENGYREYVAHDRAGRMKELPTKEIVIGKRQNGEPVVQSVMVWSLDEYWLPEKLVEMRKNKAARGRGTYTPPKVPKKGAKAAVNG